MCDNNNYNHTKGLTIKSIASRIYNREDNVYKHSVILDILNYYFEECEKELLKGEKINLSRLGTLTPHVHVPKRYNLPCCNKEEGNMPYTDVKFTQNKKLKEKMNNVYVQNIKNGYLGIGQKCECTPLQKAYLEEYGYLND